MDLKVIRDVARNFSNNATVIHYYLVHCDKRDEVLLNDCKERIHLMHIDNTILRSAINTKDERVEVMIPFFVATNELIDVIDSKAKVSEYFKQYENMQSMLPLVFPNLDEEIEKQKAFLEHWISTKLNTQS